MDTAVTATNTRTAPVYEILAQDLKDLGVTTVFGLMSDDTIGLVVAIDAIGIHWVGARHETQALLAADGYASATGQMAVAVIGRGPAMSNGMHGMMNCLRTGSPVLILSGDVEAPSSEPNPIGPDYKHFNAAGVLTAAGVRNFTAHSPAIARQMLADAATVAQTGTTCVLLLPTSVQNTPITIRTDEKMPLAWTPKRAPMAPRAQAVRAAATVLRDAKRPIIVAGQGAHRAGARAAIEALAEKTGAVLFTTLKAKDLWSGNPYNCGIMGSFTHKAARQLVEQTDCVIVFGAGLNFLTTSSGTWVPPVPIIQIDTTRASFGRFSPVDVAVLGDAKLTAEALTAAVADRAADDKPFHTEAVRNSLANVDLASEFQAENTARTVDPRSFAIALNKLLPQQRNMIYDAGNFFMVIGYLNVPSPSNQKISSDFSSMGAGFGTALGFSAARPGETNVFVVGDGGFVMTLSELETVVRCDIPMVIVVMNDAAYGAEVQFARIRNLPEQTSLFPDIDFAPVAEAFGFEAYTIRSIADLEKLAPVLAKPEGPILLDVKVNADVRAPYLTEFENLFFKK